MHFVRRAAARAAARAASSSPSTSFLTKARSAGTSPFALQSRQQGLAVQTLSKRFYSEQKPAESSDQNGGHGAVAEAIDNAKEYVGETAEKAREAFSSAAETASSYAPRGVEREGESLRSRPNRFDQFTRRVKPTNSLYVGNLLFDVSAADLEREFAPFGQVQRAIIATDDRGLSKGFGYVTFNTEQEATAAITGKHQTVFEGRRIVVNYQIEQTRRAPQSPPSKTLFIGNIPFEMSDADLNKLFRDIRNVLDVRVAIDRRTGQPRGFAHADFVDVESAIAGKQALGGKEIYGRTLRVDFSAGNRERRGRESNGAETDAPAPPLEP